jgi:small-conductance mechanosensitive channel
LNVGINSSSAPDLRKAHAMLLAATQGGTGILSDPPPSVTLDKFEPLFINATVRYWLNWQTTDPFVVSTALSQAFVEAAQRDGIDLFLSTQKTLDAIKTN